MKEVRMRAVVDATKCTGCDTCIHVCPTVAFTRPGERPIEKLKLPPCSAACPAGNDVEGFIALLQGGQWEAALDLLLSTNPLPGVTGRVCDAPCQSQCNRGSFDDAVSIRTLERMAADYGTKKPGKVQAVPGRKEKVAVVGSGPAGLSCAFHLARKGFGVTVFEKKAEIGGVLRYGIPAYRLPKDVLDRELERLRNLDITFKPRKELGRNLLTEDLQEYDALYLALGFHKALSLGVPGEGHPQVLEGIGFLERVNSEAPPRLRGRALVIGGGNTAVDSARCALRLGAGRTTLVYRRREEDMPAIKAEIEEMKGEGVEMLTLTTPVGIVAENGGLSDVRCIRMKMGETGEDGRRRPVPLPDSEFALSADTVIVCVGSTGDLSGAPLELRFEKGRIVADFFGRTSAPKVFAGGDVATGEGTVAHAVGSGRRGAEAIASYLLGDSESVQGPERPVVSAEEMNFDYCDPTASLKPSRIPVERAVSGFDEIHRTPMKTEAFSETERCLHCGVMPDFHPENCFGCTNCSSRCPSYAIALEELEHPYVVGVTVEKEMIPEICRICEKTVMHPETLVCQCTGTRANEIVAAILKGAKNIVDIRRMTGAHTGCGSACISPIFRLMQAAGLEIGTSPQSDMWYPNMLTIWDVPDHVIRDFESRGFKFQEDKDFFEDWLEHIRIYCEKNA